jgi:glycosyltransferase involved in cell wall biosynthesis
MSVVSMGRAEFFGTGAADAPLVAQAQESAARRPHVCFVAPMVWPILAADPNLPVVGGAEVQQAFIARGLARAGYRVSMICLDYGQPEGTQVEGVRVYKMHKPDEGIPVLRFLHPRLTSLWRALKRVDADIYYQRSATPHTGFIAVFCALHGKRSIYAGASDADFTSGGQDIQYARDRFIFRYGLRKVDRIIVQNPVQRERALANHGRESTLIASSYAPPVHARADPAGYVLWVGAIRAQKRPEVFLDLARQLPQHRFVMIGGGDRGSRGEAYAQHIRSAAQALPNVQFKGFLPYQEADRHFDGARLLVNTSLIEGFPNTFLQAWARGVPTVGFVAPGARRHGLPVSCIVAGIEQAGLEVGRLMGDDFAWRDASQRALEHFRECHSVDSVLDLYEREFEELMRA